jgi:hypothetical protein
MLVVPTRHDTTRHDATRLPLASCSHRTLNKICRSNDAASLERLDVSPPLTRRCNSGVGSRPCWGVNSNNTIFLRSCSWLRHCATSRQVAGSIPDGVIGSFYWHNPSGRTMALGSTQPLTEMSTRYISWGVNAAGAYGRQHYHLLCGLSRNLGASTSWNLVGLSRPAMGLLYLLLCALHKSGA